MATPGQELSSIDFASMIGGPLLAVVNAQAQAAMGTVNFIKQVGFQPGEDQGIGSQSTGDPVYVSFDFDKEVPKADGSGTEIEKHQLKVPMLTIVPIPYLRVSDTTIDFNAKINSVEFSRTDTTVKVDSSLEAKAGFAFGSAKLKVAASFQRSNQEGQSVNRTYSLAVHVKAVQEEMPAGMEKVLSILENSITSQKKVA